LKETMNELVVKQMAVKDLFYLLNGSFFAYNDLFIFRSSNWNMPEGQLQVYFLNSALLYHFMHLSEYKSSHLLTWDCNL